MGILRIMRKYTFLLLITVMAAFSLPTIAGDAQDKADYAVGNILFEYEVPDGDGASYVIEDNGFVNIQFAENIPEDLYSKVLTALKSHPDIKGVLR